VDAGKNLGMKKAKNGSANSTGVNAALYNYNLQYNTLYKIFNKNFKIPFKSNSSYNFASKRAWQPVQ